MEKFIDKDGKELPVQGNNPKFKWFDIEEARFRFHRHGGKPVKGNLVWKDDTHSEVVFKEQKN